MYRLLLLLAGSALSTLAFSVRYDRYGLCRHGWPLRFCQPSFFPIYHYPFNTFPYYGQHRISEPISPKVPKHRKLNLQSGEGNDYAIHNKVFKENAVRRSTDFKNTRTGPDVVQEKDLNRPAQLEPDTFKLRDGKIQIPRISLTDRIKQTKPSIVIGKGGDKESKLDTKKFKDKILNEEPETTSSLDEVNGTKQGTIVIGDEIVGSKPAMGGKKGSLTHTDDDWSLEEEIDHSGSEKDYVIPPK